MKKARFVLKIVAMSLAAAGAICAIVAYGDCLKEGKNSPTAAVHALHDGGGKCVSFGVIHNAKIHVQLFVCQKV